MNNRFLRFITSVRLAIVLVGVIAALAALSTLIPQGNNRAFYEERYPKTAGAIVALGFDRFFRSALFLVPLGVFAINLLACTVRRIYLESSGRRAVAPGPDLVHFGLLLLIVAALVTVFARREAYVVLGEGETVFLLDGYSITLESFETIRYPDGSPREWRSTLFVRRSGEPAGTQVVRVNHPQRVGPLVLYQHSYSEEPGELPGQTRPVTILLAVSDPGFWPVVVALSMIMTGLAVTFLQKAAGRRRTRPE